MNANERYSTAFMLIAEHCAQLGATPISKYDMCFEFELSGGWKIAVNAHPEERLSTLGKVPAFHAAVFADGWLVLLLHPQGGVWIGEDREHDFIEALQKVIDTYDHFARE